jgi:hypothetical protein
LFTGMKTNVVVCLFWVLLLENAANPSGYPVLFFSNDFAPHVRGDMIPYVQTRISEFRLSGVIIIR